MTDGAFVRRVLVTLGLGALALLVGFFLVFGINVVLLAFAGVLMALFLRGLTRLVRDHTPLGDGVSLAAVILGLVALVALGGWLIAPSLTAQASELAKQIPQAAGQIRDGLSQSSWGRMVLANMPEPGSVARSLLGSSGGTVVATLGSVVGGIVNVVLVLFIGLYVAAAPGVYRRGMLRLVPPSGRHRAAVVLDRLGAVLQRWLVGKVVGMLVIGVLTTIGLSLIGVPAALALGAVAGLLNFVPYLGPVLSFVPAALLALTQSSAMLGWVLALYVVIQGLESYVITPLIQQEAVALPPALIITAQVLLGVSVGWLGVLLATPLTACVVVLVNQLYLDGARPARAGVERPAA